MIMKNLKSADSPSSGYPYRIPWWGNVLLAVGGYCSLKFVIPELHFTNPTLQSLAQAAPTFAPLVAILFLLLAAKQLYDVDSTEKTEKGNKKPDNSQGKNPEK
jgi:hypothetical protein